MAVKNDAGACFQIQGYLALKHWALFKLAGGALLSLHDGTRWQAL